MGSQVKISSEGVVTPVEIRELCRKGTWVLPERVEEDTVTEQEYILDIIESVSDHM